MEETHYVSLGYETLFNSSNASTDKHSDAIRRPVPDAAAIYCLLGKLFQGDREIKRAVDCYVSALKLNPFMWDAFEHLCDTGTHVQIKPQRN